MKKTFERHFVDSDIKNEAEYYNHLMHIATYEYAMKYVNGKTVLDYGCGSGYGSHILAGKAARVTAVDISTEAINNAKNSFFANNLIFKDISELTDERFDIITLFQVIEHVPHAKECIKKIKNLLNPGGCLLVSTPDRTNRLFPVIQRPWNVFHLKEYSGSGLSKLLQEYFTKVDMLKIGSKSDLALKEIERTRRQRFITLPCTLFFYPDFLRVLLLNLQVGLYMMIISFRREKEINDFDNLKTKHSINEIEIDKNLSLSTDLLAICTE